MYDNDDCNLNQPSCSICGQRDNLSLEPSRSQLIFGGFPTRVEFRCPKCEAEIAKKIGR